MDLSHFDINILFQSGFVLFVLKEIWQSIKGRDKEYELALRNNTIALVELRGTLNNLADKIKDVTDRVRALEERS